MGGPSLNRDELEYLLHGGGSEDVSGEQLGATDASAAPTRKVHSGDATSHRDKPRGAIPQAAMERLQQLQRSFAREWSRVLEQRLRAPVQVHLEECAVREYGEYVLTLERPTTFQVLRAYPLSELFCLDMPLSVVFPMIDRLLGGGLRCDPIIRRPLTEIELRLLQRLTGWMMSAMAAAWRERLELTLSIENVECNPRHVRCFSPSTKLVVCQFEVDMRFARGPVRMALAGESVAELESLIDRQRRGELVRPDLGLGNTDRWHDDHAELAVVVAEMSCPVTRIDALQVGELLQTETPAAAQVQVRVDDETVYLARPGQYHGKRAFRIEQRVLDESG